MMARRAPDGCLQYFTENQGALASFNFDKSSPMAPNQDYSICFKSSPDICAVALQADIFNFGEDPFSGTNDDHQPFCLGGFWGAFGALGENGTDLGKDRFCGKDFGDANGKMLSFQKPFVFRVKSGPKPLQGSSGFLMIYNLIQC